MQIQLRLMQQAHARDGYVNWHPGPMATMGGMAYRQLQANGQLHPVHESPSPLCGTHLHYATLWGLYSVVELLINEHSQNVNSHGFTDSTTPLHVASGRGHLEVAFMLIERGADVSAQDGDGQAPLHLALQKGGLEIARMLIEHGADGSAQDKDGWTPLHLASEVGELEIARMLIERGADGSAQDKDGRTPLHPGFGGGETGNRSHANRARCRRVISEPVSIFMEFGLFLAFYLFTSLIRTYFGLY